MLSILVLTGPITLAIALLLIGSLIFIVFLMGTLVVVQLLQTIVKDVFECREIMTICFRGLHGLPGV